MAVQVAPQLAGLQQAGESRAAVRGGLQLPPVLAQLGLDVGQAQQRVDVGLGGAGPGLAGGVVEHPVLGHVQPLAHRHVPQRHVVLLGAREVLEQVAELLGGDDPQVDAQARVGGGAGAGGPAGVDALERPQLGERRRQRGGVVGGGDDVQVLDAVGPAAGGAGQLHPVRRRIGAQRRHDRLADRQRPVQDHADLAAVPGRGPLQRRADVLLGLGPEAPQVPHPLRLDGRPQRVQRVDAQLVVEHARPLGPQAGQAGDRHQPGRELGPQLLRRRDLAGVDERLDLLLQGGADPGQLGGPARARQPRHRGRGLAHRLGRVAVGHDAVDDRPVELVQVAQLLQGGGDLAVAELRHGSGH